MIYNPLRRVQLEGCFPAPPVCDSVCVCGCDCALWDRWWWKCAVDIAYVGGYTAVVWLVLRIEMLMVMLWVKLILGIIPPAFRFLLFPNDTRFISSVNLSSPTSLHFCHPYSPETNRRHDEVRGHHIDRRQTTSSVGIKQEEIDDSEAANDNQAPWTTYISTWNDTSSRQLAK